MITPISDHVLIKEIESNDEVKTKSGIYLATESKQSRHKEGEVLAVGPGQFIEFRKIENLHLAIYKPMELKTGDKVIFSFGEKYVIDGEEYYILKESDILAKF